MLLLMLLLFLLPLLLLLLLSPPLPLLLLLILLLLVTPSSGQLRQLLRRRDKKALKCSLVQLRCRTRKAKLPQLRLCESNNGNARASKLVSHQRCGMAGWSWPCAGELTEACSRKLSTPSAALPMLATDAIDNESAASAAVAIAGATNGRCG